MQLTSLPLPESRKAFLAIAGDRFANDPRLDELLSALDGVPLAITLMAGAAEGQPNLVGIWIRWHQERTRMLQRANADRPALNIEVSYEISIQGPRMTDVGRRLLSVLGMFSGGVAQSDIDGVFPSNGTRAAAVLLQVGLAHHEAGRLRLLAPLREYVQRERPPQPEDLAPAVGFYLALAAAHGQQAGREGGAQAIARLAPEAANIEAAILAGLAGSDLLPAIQAALAFSEFARFTGLGSMAPLERAAAAAGQQGDHRTEANCIRSLGDITLARSDHDTAQQRYDQALPLYQQVGDLLGQANCIKSLGDIALARSDHDTARQRYDQALPLYQQVGSLLGQANCIKGLGNIGGLYTSHKLN